MPARRAAAVAEVRQEAQAAAKRDAANRAPAFPVREYPLLTTNSVADAHVLRARLAGGKCCVAQGALEASGDRALRRHCKRRVAAGVRKVEARRRPSPLVTAGQHEDTPCPGLGSGVRELRAQGHGATQTLHITDDEARPCSGAPDGREHNNASNALGCPRTTRAKYRSRERI